MSKKEVKDNPLTSFLLILMIFGNRQLVLQLQN